MANNSIKTRRVPETHREAEQTPFESKKKPTEDEPEQIQYEANVPPPLSLMIGLPRVRSQQDPEYGLPFLLSRCFLRSYCQ